MAFAELDVVTGAFGYTGRHITGRLLAAGRRVRTLTGHPARPNPFGDRVEVFPFSFDRPEELAASLEGARTLYNTYWVRFDHGPVTFDRAIANTRKLLAAAKRAGVGRIVHVSITNPKRGSPLPYFRGKAVLEKAVAESGVSHAVVRPTVIFGGEDVFINNVAWLLRHFPVFAIPGSGAYRIQPVHVEDVARICVEAGCGRGNLVVDAAGPETFTFEEMVRLIARRVGSRPVFVHVPPPVALMLSKAVGTAVRDVLLTGEELEGLMAELVVSRSAPLGRIGFGEWLQQNGRTLGLRYASELGRHYRPPKRTAGAAARPVPERSGRR